MKSLPTFLVIWFTCCAAFPILSDEFFDFLYPEIDFQPDTEIREFEDKAQYNQLLERISPILSDVRIKFERDESEPAFALINNIIADLKFTNKQAIAQGSPLCHIKGKAYHRHDVMPLVVPYLFYSLNKVLKILGEDTIKRDRLTLVDQCLNLIQMYSSIHHQNVKHDMDSNLFKSFPFCIKDEAIKDYRVLQKVAEEPEKSKEIFVVCLASQECLLDRQRLFNFIGSIKFDAKLFEQFCVACLGFIDNAEDFFRYHSIFDGKFHPDMNQFLGRLQHFCYMFYLTRSLVNAILRKEKKVEIIEPTIRPLMAMIMEQLDLVMKAIKP